MAEIPGPEELSPEAAARLLQAPRCPACGALIQAGRQKCSGCGAPVVRAGGARCLDCSVQIEAGKSYCADCAGKRIAAVDQQLVALNGPFTRTPGAADGFLAFCCVAIVGGIIGAAAAGMRNVAWAAGFASLTWVGVLGLVIRGAVISAHKALRSNKG